MDDCSVAMALAGAQHGQAPRNNSFRVVATNNGAWRRKPFRFDSTIVPAVLMLLRYAAIPDLH
jgi:hypothetical protein